MQNKQNDDTSAIGMVVGVVAMAVVAMALMMAALVAFLCLGVTLLALYVLKFGDVRLFNADFERDWARAYLLRGLAGAALAPAFLLFVGLIGVTFFDGAFPAQTDWRVWIGVSLCGYVFGSMGIELIRSFSEEEETHTPSLDFMREAPPVEKLPRRNNVYPFANWNDEERD